jgi:hypothetical protein
MGLPIMGSSAIWLTRFLTVIILPKLFRITSLEDGDMGTPEIFVLLHYQFVKCYADRNWFLEIVDEQSLRKNSICSSKISKGYVCIFLILVGPSEKREVGVGKQAILLVMSGLVKFLSLSNSLELCSDHFPSWLCRPGGINKDPTVWPDGARPSLYIFKNNFSWTNLQIWSAWTLWFYQPPPLISWCREY